MKKDKNQASVMLGDYHEPNPLSLQTDSFRPAPADFVPSKPVRSKVDLNATNYELGSDTQKYYETAAMAQGFNSRMEEKPAPRLKNLNQHIDVISGEIRPQNHVNSAFEGFVEHRQPLTSSNKLELPSDRVVTDPITGRTLAKRA